MSSYYNRVFGHLNAGDTAKAEDINSIQDSIEDMISSSIDDHHERTSYILGGRENDFLLTPSKKILGRYLDTYSIPSDENLKPLSMREYGYRQPIAKTKSTIYSLIVKMGNNTPYNVPVKCSLQDITGKELRSDIVTLRANTDKAEYEFIFDYNEATTAFGLDMEDLKREDGKQIPPRTKKGSYKEGINHRNKQEIKDFSIGVTQLYAVFEPLGIQKSVSEAIDMAYIDQLNENSFVLYADKNGEYGGMFDSYLEQTQTKIVYDVTPYSLYFKDVYSTDINYTCTGGEAIIGGEKVICMDSHVNISGAHEYGNVLSLVYMDKSGRLHSANSKASINNVSTHIEDWEMEDMLPPEYLLIAKVLIYSDYNKEPLIIQDDTNQETRPRSHHERLRRLEKQMNYTQDIAIPPRLKYTITGDDWVDIDGDAGLLASFYKDGAQDNDADKSNYYLTMDAEGNLVVKTTQNEVTVAPVTLMDDAKTVDTSKIVSDEMKETTTNTTTTTTTNNSSTTQTGSQSKNMTTEEAQTILNDIENGMTLAEIQNKYNTTYTPMSSSVSTIYTEETTVTEVNTKTAIDTDFTTEQTDAILKAMSPNDLKRLNRISEMTNISLDTEAGAISLKNKSAAKQNSLATTDDEAKETKFNPWDDYAENRPSSKDITPTSRQYTVVSGKNGANDFESEFPAMTFYTDKKYTLTGLTIPIVKFENCSSIKFHIWKRQNPNNKTNEVWFEKKIYTSKEFSLDNARTDEKYQYMDDGFTIEFEGNGLELPEGQYVIVCVHVPKSGSGSCWVDTYKPENSRDFCIRYYGAANASHFLLKERYQEIWYNPAIATGSKSGYETEGTFISGAVVLDENTPPIVRVKTDIGKTTVPQGCSIEIYGNTGSGFQKLNTDSENIDKDDGNETTMKGNRTTFRWKAVLKGDGENTPTIEYDEDKKYALQFTFIHETPATGNSSEALQMADNGCITSKPFDGDAILREYLGDNIFDVDDNRFSNFEFARVWAEKQNNNNLSIDISGSDITQEIKDSDNHSHKFSAYSLHYVDLNLNDFSHTSVDYSNYDASIEKDEYNMRLKLDTQHSYNDNDIQLFDINDFEVIDEDNGITFDNKECTIPKNYNPKQNVLLYRLRLKNPIDLTKYTGIKIAFKVNKTSATDTSLKGLGVYLSSQYEDTIPSNLLNDPSEVLVQTQRWLDDFGINTTYADLVAKYKDKIIKIPPEQDEGLKGMPTQYYKYISRYDSSTNSLIYKLTQLHDIKSYYIYELGTIKPDTKEDTIVYQEIEIDQDSTNLKYVEEIGILLLGDEKVDEDSDEYKLNVTNNVTLSLNQFKSIENDYYPIFNPGDNHELKLSDPSMTQTDSNYFIRKNGEITINNNTYGNTGIQGNVPTTFTTPITQINIKPSTMNSAGQTLCYFENSFATTKYQHIGIQIASDVYLPKYSLKLNLCRDKYGQDVIESINIPTLNYIWTPNKQGNINLSQVFKKIENLDIKIQSLSISTTNRFKYYMNNTLGTNKSRINIFIGKIVMYKAETIPMFHKKMRFKFYDEDYNSDIVYGTNTTVVDSGDIDSMIMIRKIGAVLDYR